MTLGELVMLLQPALAAGVSISIIEDGTTIDLHTGAKSHCHLHLHKGKVTALMRYDQTAKITDFESVLEAVSSCACGRTSFNPSWLKVLEENGYVLAEIFHGCI